MKDIYDNRFYNILHNTSEESAQMVVPLVMDLLKPGSVLDVGCGEGSWLNTFQTHGVTDVYGVDGDWVELDKLKIDGALFKTQDLNLPLNLDRKFDLAMSVEVAEHLEETSAETFVDTLTGHSNTILFSAAIPFQMGFNHINEQWQDYWVEKFEARGYKTIDYLRWQIWHMDNVSTWYKQNILLFVSEEVLNANAQLKTLQEAHKKESYSVVHPTYYLKRIEWYSDLSKYRRSELWRALRRKLFRI